MHGLPREEVTRIAAAPSEIARFSGRYAFLSNFSPAPIAYEGLTYRHVEGAFQAQKTLDPALRRSVAALASPVLAKRAGRRLPLRPDWDSVKEIVMLDLLRLKFADPALGAALLATGDAYLVNRLRRHDRYWDTCPCARCAMLGSRNRLGALLMRVREELRRRHS
jgi:ribA/ribD-fused uncharacterized protein